MIHTSELISRINELMRSGFSVPLEKLNPAATLKGDLGLDSLDAADILVCIEDCWGVTVEGERLTKLRTLQDLYNLAADSLAQVQIPLHT